MTTNDINDALGKSLAVRNVWLAALLTKCDAADIALGFMGVLQSRLGWPFNWVLGRIMKKAVEWQREHGCGEVIPTQAS